MQMFHKTGLLALISAGLLILIFNMTHPVTSPSIILLLVFGLLYCLVSSLLLLLLTILHRFGFIGGNARLLRRIALAVGGFLVFIVVLRSIGQLTLRDLAIGTIFAVILYLYYTKLRSSPSDSE